METKTIIAGFGGQGVILAGNLLAQAGMVEGKKVILVPSYGPEMRGGTANCTVILKTGEIYSPIVSHPDILIALNQPSMDKFEGEIVKNGRIFYNSSLCSPKKNRKDLTYFGIPAVDIARELGDGRVANVVMLGSVIKNTGLTSAKTLSEKALPALLIGKKARFVPINRKALQAGMLSVVKK